MIYTSYFAKWKEPVDSDFVLMATTYYKPGWFEGEWFFEVAPDKKLVEMYKKGLISSIQYANDYLKALESKKELILTKIKKFNPHKNYILLCFESPEKFCHRHILASWLNSNGYECEEY